MIVSTNNPVRLTLTDRNFPITIMDCFSSSSSNCLNSRNCLSSSHHIHSDRSFPITDYFFAKITPHAIHQCFRQYYALLFSPLFEWTNFSSNNTILIAPPLLSHVFFTTGFARIIFFRRHHLLHHCRLPSTRPTDYFSRMIIHQHYHRSVTISTDSF